MNLLQALLLMKGDAFDYTGLLQMYLRAMEDSKDRVRAIAVEAVAVLANRLGPADFQAMLKRSSANEGQRSSILQRLNRPSLPSVNVDGLVEHVLDNTITDGIDSGSVLDTPKRNGSLVGSAGKMHVALLCKVNVLLPKHALIAT